jgi:hypothetical protein
MPDSVRPVSTAETRERESRWALPVALATFLAVALIVASGFVSAVDGTGAAEVLRSVDENGGSMTLSSLMQALAFALLVFPLVYLFRAAQARSERVRSQLLGLVIAAPIFLALYAGTSTLAQQEAADEFVAGQAKPTLSRAEAKDECAADREDEGEEGFAEEFDPAEGETALAACENRKLEDDAAAEARADASLTPLATGLGFAGGFGFVAALFYSCLWAMRTGLLSRFWGSLGMALGVAVLFGLLPFLLVWFVYFGLLAIGKVPGGRPPAWEAGEAVPWPTPGERAAAELEPAEGWDEGEAEAERGADPGVEKRKRKQRE